MIKLENSEFGLEVHSNQEHQKTRKMYRKEENLYVMFVDLKSNVNGILMHYQQ